MSLMRVTIVCVGRLAREYQPVWRHYEGLIRPYTEVEVLEVPETPLSRGEENARAREGTALLGLLRKGTYTIALDRGGQQHSSEEWSAFLAQKKLHGQSHFQFLLGGASGLDARVVAAAHHCWSLSPLTFPHQMARCIFLEQMYRAIRIERGEPYHH
jgi:23S rRNA (pseudouridine1915-N3)-methyltransferase